jgi:hypothetical protein
MLTFCVLELYDSAAKDNYSICMHMLLPLDAALRAPRADANGTLSLVACIQVLELHCK